MEWKKNIIILYQIPPAPSIILGIYASGSFQYSVKYASAQNDSLKLSLSGKLVPMAELSKYLKPYINLSIGADGTLIGFSGDVIVSKSGITKQFKFYGTTSNLVIQGISGDKPTWKKSIKLFGEWSY